MGKQKNKKTECLLDIFQKEKCPWNLHSIFGNSIFETPPQTTKEVRYLPITLKKLERAFKYFSAIICIVFGGISMNGWVLFYEPIFMLHGPF
jgi:hypothetical protein